MIVVDRAIVGEAGKDFTTFIGANNETIGKQAGEIIAETLGGKGNVIELQGTAGASPDDRPRRPDEGGPRRISGY